jgi:hypothetical protein
MLVRKLFSGTLFAATALVASTAPHELNDRNFNIGQLVADDDLQKSVLPELLCKDENKKLINFEGTDEPLKGKICRAYLPKEPQGKPLFILVLGHAQELDCSSDYSGIICLYEKLKKEEIGTVLLFRTGLAIDEVGSMLSSDYKPQYEPTAVVKQTKDVIQDFIIRYKPAELRLTGFSWGGGTIAELARDDNWRQSVPVARTVMIDPISFGSFGFGLPSRKRPEFTNSPKHRNFHVYQRNDNLSVKDMVSTLQGNYPTKLIKDQQGKFKVVKDERPDDVIWQVPNTSHYQIEILPEVKDKAYKFLTSHK